jgi:two-component system OmpR family response regulator
VPSASTVAARVLIVDDNASVADRVSRALRLEGHEVWTAASAQEGLTLAQVHRPNAVVLDLRMPLAASLSLLRAIRTVPGLASIPAAIVTGDYQLDHARQHELQALSAQLHYAPLWLNELVTLARDLVACVVSRS